MVNSTFKRRIAELSAAGRAALLAILLAITCLAISPVAFLLSGLVGVWAALVAAAVVWFASAAGMGIGELFHGPNAALTKLLFGMVIRMLIPLAACLLALLTGSGLASAGFAFYVLVFYLAALPADTILTVFTQSNQNVPRLG